MATIEKRRGGYRLVFWYQSKRYQGAVKTENSSEAEGLKARVERNLQLLHEGRLEYRDGDDLFQLMISDGKLNAKPEITERITLKEFFDLYQAGRTPSKETSTSYTEDIHIKHLLRIIGQDTAIPDLAAKHLQHYIKRRLGEQNSKGEQISPITVKKELGTLSAAWNKWGFREGITTMILPTRNLDFGKRKETLPFQTWEQIERKCKDIESDLWDNLFLSTEQTESFLKHVKNFHRPWLYPMVAFCAYTGARRSEMLRARVIDIDFENKAITIREKKKDTTVKETYRNLFMVPALESVLKEWLTIHPGGEWLFSKNDGKPITVQMSNHYFRESVEGSKWQVIRGWHTLRHSLVSNLIAEGVSERVVMEIVGHLNPSTTRRYAHLFPRTIETALGLVFRKRKSTVLKSK